jgi:hypothetical protein
MSLDDGIQYVNTYYNLDVSHGVDGWYLDDMEWYPEDGAACFQYERSIPGVGLELAVVWREQPSMFEHQGWKDRNKDVQVLPLTEKDWIRFERGIDLTPEEVVEYD